ncbi:hypothetical protein AGABI1DRAFT_127426 [Agaricus bisporus var. burnettii JB137-S8]|uniref:Uncharacterized protein n=1 Tax=Agaricus bisporus var. burnettii (strain JB137-S8 / ATCC MYA-4627 / FGSC 10392) TaxID=597362 RepID=K5XWV5_AGABU|nr:uncharacterized protein AGABI1DRAFT_127426 [Agaricus bisporus var. burnettii JB137-S8]EKM79740.1 hypothetical protein AGABI1DRAFT_127426 [Agaricus bisporus var. burnettii JB137-S8]
MSHDFLISSVNDCHGLRNVHIQRALSRDLDQPRRNSVAEDNGISYIKPFEALPENIIRASSWALNELVRKTCFFAQYALVRALKERLPLAYCVTDNEIVIFNEDSFWSDSPRPKIPSPRRTLCLVDSSVNIQTPPGVILSRIDNHVAPVASPQSQHWREWSKQRIAKNTHRLCNNQSLISSRSMDKDGTPLSLEPSAIRLELFEILGPSPRNCFWFDETFIKTPEGLQITQPYCEPAVVLSNTGVLGRIFKTGNCFPPSEQGEQFHYFFFARPAYKNPLCDQPQFRYVVPTEFLERRLSDYIVTREPRKQFRLLCALAPLAQALDLVYKPYILSHICETTAPLLCHLVINRLSPSFELGPGLSLERLPVEQGQGMREYRDNTIYLPQSGGASLNAFVISENKTRVTMLHFAVAPTHKLES